MENPVKTYTYEELQNLTKDQIKDLYNSGAYTRIAIKTADLNKFADNDFSKSVFGSSEYAFIMLLKKDDKS